MGQFTPKIKVEGYTVSVPASTDTSGTVSVLTWPENAYVLGFWGRVKTAFAGVTGPYVSLGVTGDTARYMANQPVDVVNEFVMGKLVKSSAGIRKDATYLPDKYKKDLPHSMGFCEAMKNERIPGTARDIIATFGLTSGTFAALTAGELEFVIAFIDVR